MKLSIILIGLIYLVVNAQLPLSSADYLSQTIELNKKAKKDDPASVLKLYEAEKDLVPFLSQEFGRFLLESECSRGYSISDWKKVLVNCKKDWEKKYLSLSYLLDNSQFFDCERAHDGQPSQCLTNDGRLKSIADSSAGAKVLLEEKKEHLFKSLEYFYIDDFPGFEYGDGPAGTPEEAFMSFCEIVKIPQLATTLKSGELKSIVKKLKSLLSGHETGILSEIDNIYIQYEDRFTQKEKKERKELDQKNKQRVKKVMGWLYKKLDHEIEFFGSEKSICVKGRSAVQGYLNLTVKGNPKYVSIDNKVIPYTSPIKKYSIPAYTDISVYVIAPADGAYSSVEVIINPNEEATVELVRTKP